MKIPFKFELIRKNDDLGAAFVRAKVFGGWIVGVEFYDVGEIDIKTPSISIAFVPDANHEWEIEG